MKKFAIYKKIYLLNEKNSKNLVIGTCIMKTIIFQLSIFKNIENVDLFAV